MKTNTQVVVIGGGIGGCSTIYHLTQEGITDCMLLERDELTSGTTWHSAAQVTNFGGTQTMIGLKSHSIKLYKELADDPDYPINYHHATGGIRLASTQDHLDGYHHFVSLAKGMGVDFEVIDAAEAQKRHPLITTDNLLGALWDPLDGDIDPAQLCQALARRARNAGAEIVRKCPVNDLTQKADGTWIVHTDQGDITCETVVNAGGYRCNEISAMMGTELPVASMEHQYMVTDSIPELEELGWRVPLIRCPTDDFYSRQEKQGLLLGFYEQDCRTWGLDGIDPNFTMDLCPDDLDRVIPVMEGAFARVPAMAEVGVRSVVNGPITYTPDGVPLVGKIPGIRNAYCITGLRAGLGEGGGHGWLLAQMIAHGEACYDTWCLDPRRFSRYANQEFTALKAIEDYQNEFRFHMPHEHRPAGRCAKTTPLYERLKANGAEFATVNGWERTDYFKPNADFHEKYSFSYNNVHDVVGQEIANITSGCGITEVNGFNRYELSGSGVHDFLDRMFCGHVTRKSGKVGLGYLLNHQGNVKAEATIANLPDGRVWYGSAAAAEHHDMDWLVEHMPDDGSVQIRSLTNDWTILVVSGPRARDVLAQACPRTDWSTFAWLTAQNIRIGHAEAVAMNVSFNGELSWELHVPNSQLLLAHSTLTDAAEALAINMTGYGLRAVESMRLEMGYLHWKSDLITEFNPFETGLDRFVKMEKDSDFIGRDALKAMTEQPMRKRLVCLHVDNDAAAPHPGDSVLNSAGDCIGTVTSSGWGYRVGKTLAYAFIDPDHGDIGTAVQLQYLGQVHAGQVVEMGQFPRQF